jgi:hypothetical protein
VNDGARKIRRDEAECDGGWGWGMECGETSASAGKEQHFYVGV